LLRLEDLSIAKCSASTGDGWYRGGKELRNSLYYKLPLLVGGFLKTVLNSLISLND